MSALRAAWLRFLIRSGEQHIQHLRRQVQANERDVEALRVQLAVIEAQGARA